MDTLLAQYVPKRIINKVGQVWGLGSDTYRDADLAPGSAWTLVEILHRAGCPKGVLNLVMGQGSVVGQAMLDSPEIDAMSFMGSVQTGKRVAEASILHMRNVQLEMGGKNPLVVLNDSDLDVAVNCALNGAFFSIGQRCTASSRLVVQEGIHDHFVKALIQRLKKLVVNDALKPGTGMGPAVDERQLSRDKDFIRIGKEEGATLAWGGERLTRDTPGFYIQPALSPRRPILCASAARRSSVLITPRSFSPKSRQRTRWPKEEAPCLES